MSKEKSIQIWCQYCDWEIAQLQLLIQEQPQHKEVLEVVINGWKRTKAELRAKL